MRIHIYLAIGTRVMVHKSQKTVFKSLYPLSVSPILIPKDVANTSWHKMVAELGLNHFDNDDYEWTDRDASWHKTPIRISIPFHRRTNKCGVKDFYLGNFYHHSLVKVLKEKLSNTEHHEWFHYKPFELWWTPPSSSSATWVHGELYTSPTFLDAYREVQEAPNEPGCSLKKVVIRMMFASDATFLTMFGDAKLWPGYLYCENDTKYCHCWPSSNCCEHIAYLQAVSYLQWNYSYPNSLQMRANSSLTLSKILLPSVMEDTTLVKHSWPIAIERWCTCSGVFYSTMNSLKLGYMASSSNVEMGFCVTSTLEYSPIQLITQKSRFSTYPLMQALPSNWNLLECFLPASGMMGNTLVNSAWSLFQMHIKLGLYRTGANKSSWLEWSVITTITWLTLQGMSYITRDLLLTVKPLIKYLKMNCWCPQRWAVGFNWWLYNAYGAFAEHIFGQALPIRLQPLSNAHGWFDAWIWIGGMERSIHSFASYLGCIW